MHCSPCLNRILLNTSSTTTSYRRLVPSIASCKTQYRARSFHNRTFQEGDILCLRRAKSAADEEPLLTEPLKLQPTPFEDVRHAFNCRNGIIKHKDLIGKKERDILETSKGTKMIATWPTLEEYIILSKKRTTTPIYPGDAQGIVNLLDLHVTAPPATATTSSSSDSLLITDATPTTPSSPIFSDLSSTSEIGNIDSSEPGTVFDISDDNTSEPESSTVADEAPEAARSTTDTTPPPSTPTTAPSPSPADETYSPMEILEVGTGMGSLTLHLARAIHASSNVNVDPTKPGTILHTVDLNISTSNAAKKLVKGFRRGMYYTPDSVKFHSDGAGPWLVKELEARSGLKLTYISTTNNNNTTTASDADSYQKGEIEKYMIDYKSHRFPFLHAALLDVPFAEPYLPLLSACLHQGAFLGFFAPSITQLVRLITYSQANGFPFFFEQTVEFPNSFNDMGKNLREWDIRRVRMKIQEKKRVRSLKSVAGPVEVDVAEEDGGGIEVEEAGQSSSESRKVEVPNFLDIDDEWVTVCRPKVGGRVRAGGFYAVARRKADYDQTYQA